MKSAYLVTLTCGHKIRLRSYPYPKGKYMCMMVPSCGPYSGRSWTHYTDSEHNKSAYNIVKATA